MDTLGKLLFDRLQKDFKFSIKDRFYVVAETKMYRKGEDEKLWKEDKTGNLTYQAFFDGEFLCFFTNKMSLNDAYVSVLKSLLKAYKDKKIYWNTFLYDLDDKKRKDEVIKEEQEFESIGKKATTKEEKMIHEAIKQTRKEKKKPSKLKIATVADIQKYG